MATSTYVLLSAAASTNATSVKARKGRMFAYHGYCAAASPRYLKFYNKASTPTVGTDTPVKVVELPPQTAFVVDMPGGYEFDLGIAFALTTGSANNDTGALTAGDVRALNIDYA